MVYSGSVVGESHVRSGAREVADRWCRDRGAGWSLCEQLGEGGTAPVFEVMSPDGPRALKVYDEKFSSGARGEIEIERIKQQIGIGLHDCPSLVRVYDGGEFNGRLCLLMSRAPGSELEKHLKEVPRSSIREIMHQVAQACLFLRERDLCHRDVKAANIYATPPDFAKSTLLDVSVARNVHDPVGLGTDHDGQLPVLATARYSPPEYLFRLIDPDALLWHALTVYQLGALLHDLIMRTPLFQAEYEQSEDNRYRFAWLVATKIPAISVTDVDEDLVFLARRALDKDWKRRSELQIEEFLNDPARRSTPALQMLGFGRRGDALPAGGLAVKHARLDRVANKLEEHLTKHFREHGVTTRHEVRPGSHGDASRSVELTWDTSSTTGQSETIRFQLAVRWIERSQGVCFGGSAKLTRTTVDEKKQIGLLLPDVPEDEETLDETLFDQANQAFKTLANEIFRAKEIVSQAMEAETCRCGG